MKHIFGYARVSAIDQNLATQLDALERLGCHQIFQDKITGTSTSRPALDQLLAKLRPGDQVVVVYLDRLGRDSQHMIQLVTGWAAQGVHFRALDLGVDTSTPTGELMLKFFSAIADYNRKNILEKTQGGRELAKERGVHMGRRKGVDQAAYNKVKTAFDKKLSVKETARLTGISLSSVKRYRKLIDQQKETPVQS